MSIFLVILPHNSKYADMFTFIKSINDINQQINNSPIYYSRILNVNGKEYWLQYCHMSFKESIRYKIGGDVMGCAAVQVIKKEDSDSFSVYKYNGTLVIDRHLENNVIDDTIENIQDLETEIQEFLIKD